MILASASPRRRELLERAGFQLTIEPADVDETRLPQEGPQDLVLRLATSKALACLELHPYLGRDDVILAADTIVWLGDTVLGKPVDEEDACRMLHALSGKTHHVSTGVCLLTETGSIHERAFVETTDVTFKSLTDEEINAYVASGEPLDKAGAYGIQGGAGAFVCQLDGDYDNVVGLPIAHVLDELMQMGIGPTPTSITRIPGILSAHDTDTVGGTGCTVIICPNGATGAVDVRGGAPATRETDLLRPEETRQGIGLDVGVTRVPIVSGACLFDLMMGNPAVRPTLESGIRATQAALSERDVLAPLRTPLARGNVGAGTGCSVGKFAEPSRAMKSGLGEAVEASGRLVCGAVAAVNACGDVVDPDTGEPIAGLLSADGNRIEDSAQLLRNLAATMPLERTNTTISCVVTNARLTKAEATKVAQMAADAYAHALRPAHSTNDGDTIFVMATGEVTAPVDAVGTLATRALERAIADGARQATSAFGLISAHELAR